MQTNYQKQDIYQLHECILKDKTSIMYRLSHSQCAMKNRSKLFSRLELHSYFLGDKRIRVKVNCTINGRKKGRRKVMKNKRLLFYLCRTLHLISKFRFYPAVKKARKQWKSVQDIEHDNNGRIMASGNYPLTMLSSKNSFNILKNKNLQEAIGPVGATTSLITC